MGISVKEFMGSSVGRQMKLLAGAEGTGNDISGVTIIEVPDIVRYIDGGEALMTGLYAFQNCSLQEFQEYILQLKPKKISAVFLKIRENVTGFGEKISFLYRFCEENRVPLLQVPMELAFPTIMNYIMEQLFDEEVTMMKYFRTTHDNFFAIALKPSRDESAILEMLGMLEQLIGNPVFIYNERRRCIYPGEKAGELLVIRRNARAYDPGVFTKQKYQRQKLEGGMQYIIRLSYSVLDYVYLVINAVNSPLTKMDYIAIENAILALRLEYGRLHAMREVERRYQQDLIENLLLGKIDSGEELEKCMQTLQLRADRRYRVYSCALQAERPSPMNFEDKQKNIQLLERYLRDAFRNLLLHRENDRIILVEQVEEQLLQKDFLRELEGKYQEVQEMLSRDDASLRLRIGVSNICENVPDVADAYRESGDALKFLMILGEDYSSNHIMLFSELGIFRFLYRVEDPETLREYIPQTLQLLLDYRKSQREELLKTLKVYLNNNQNLSRTAQELFVHYKTAAYRIDKISKITGMNFDNPNEVLSVRIGLIIQRIIDTRERRNL